MARRPAISKKAILEGWQKLHAPEPPRPTPKRSLRDWLNMFGVIALIVLIVGWLLLVVIGVVLEFVPVSAGILTIGAEIFTLYSYGMIVLLAVVCGPILYQMFYQMLRTPPAPIGLRLLSGFYLLIGLIQGVVLIAYWYAEQGTSAQTVVTLFITQFGSIENSHRLISIAALALAFSIWRREHSSLLWALLYNAALLASLIIAMLQHEVITTGPLVVSSLFLVATVYLLLPTTRRAFLPPATPQSGWRCHQCGMINIPERNTCKHCHTAQ